MKKLVLVLAAVFAVTSVSAFANNHEKKGKKPAKHAKKDGHSKDDGHGHDGEHKDGETKTEEKK